ncbi:hypothetical protein MKY84_05310 [Chryseomicrobium sp. FSL W7-1435]|uniref:hypothetical protein n=1 Tax=Chryseomicrobium sp. FSL W7-1435 TaxID=2921704 RepID=UPI003159B36B
MRISGVLLSILLIVLTGCQKEASQVSPEEINAAQEETILENAWSYVQTTQMPQSEEWQDAWMQGEIETLTLTKAHIRSANLEDRLIGQSIYSVTPSAELNLIAEPTLLVDPESMQVIGVLPGE